MGPNRVISQFARREVGARSGPRGAEERPSAQLVRIPPPGPPPRCVPARARATFRVSG
jgi:hypothetical protein